MLRGFRQLQPSPPSERTHLLPTKSRFPCSVYHLVANPRTSRAVSAAPRDPKTVEKRTNFGVCLPTSVRTLAQVNSLREVWSSKSRVLRHRKSVRNALGNALVVDWIGPSSVSATSERGWCSQ